MFRTSSKVARERIWRRAPAKHAMWDAVGDGTESEVAALVSIAAEVNGESVTFILRGQVYTVHGCGEYVMFTPVC